MIAMLLLLFNRIVCVVDGVVVNFLVGFVEVGGDVEDIVGLSVVGMVLVVVDCNAFV